MNDHTTNTVERTVPPRYIACLLNASRFCEPDLLARCGGTLWLSGFYDDSLNVHICSLTPCVFVHGLTYVPGEFPESAEANEALFEELQECSAAEDLSNYYQRRDIDKRRERSPEDFHVLDFDFDAESTESEREEEVREYLSGNPVFS